MAPKSYLEAPRAAQRTLILSPLAAQYKGYPDTRRLLKL